MSDNANHSKLVVATRLHLGNASSPPDAAKIESQISAFANFVATNCPPATKAVIAVDATPKVEGFDYVEAVRQACAKLGVDGGEVVVPQVLPVTPWGRFVPALNALIAHAVQECKAELILFVSAETKASLASVQTLCESASEDDTLVAGALLGGHLYGHDSASNTTAYTAVELNGRTTPWNTLSVWKLSKLALTGFQLISEGLLTDDEVEPSYGVEEVLAIATIQNLLGAEQAKAKLQLLSDIEWNQEFDDEERRQWHERKMNSKIERADRQLKLTGLNGTVHHC